MRTGETYDLGLPSQPPKASQSQKSEVPPKKVYSREFKLETLRLLKSSSKTKADLERELGLYPGQIRLWERSLNREGGNVESLEQAFPGTAHHSDAEAELSRLKRENEILRQERDILEEAIACGHSPVFSRTQDQS